MSIVAEAEDDCSGGDALTSVSGVDCLLVPRIGLVGAFFGGRAQHLLAKLCEGADVLHVHGIWDALLLAAGAESRRAGVPYVVVPHGMLDPWSLSQKPWKKRLGLMLGSRQLLDRAAVLHVLNQDEADRLKPLKLRAGLALVPNGVSLGEVDPLPGPNEFRAGQPSLGVNPYILFLSRLHFKKGLDILGNAFAILAAEHPNLRLVVAGADDGEQANFERRVRDHELRGRVHLVGPVYGRAKWAALAGAAVFCLPSRQEGFSMAILEALACGRPVVITQNCHFPEVAEAGAGVVTSLQAESVAAGLRQILADPIAAARMGAAGRRLVEERFTWDRVAKQCDRMYADAGIRSRSRARGNSAS